ncbi:hypothetical protein PR202_ga19625 [Eleusine coracana subsp. coracana]|uniref:Major facilitator superfamily (MFS) profile domain-containing protein n=1 Tax=Eleusine coracana subsp. coracana TaxID=191504 RepID=A0AAV5CVT3_ELECO|nr:hypothetical protein PR202_ga19625 [Eleusine coracana subsp. coracana]
MGGGSHDHAQRVVVVAGSPVVNPDSSPAPPAPVAEAKPELPAAAAAQVEPKDQQRAAPAPAEASPVEGKQAGLQAMAVTMVRDVETGVDTSTSDGAAGEKPSWFTPKRLLVMFCIINMLNYVDRGAIASNGVNGSQKSCSGGTCTSGSGIQGDFNLNNNFEDGVLSSAFMVGLLVASPIFASLAKMLVGNSLHWRAAFWGESILMVPFVILGFVIKPLDLKGFAHNTTKEYGPMRNPEVQDETNNNGTKHVEAKLPQNSFSSFGKRVMVEIGHFGKDMKELLQEKGTSPTTLLSVLISYWGPKAGQDIYNMASADLMFGGITIVCGIFGTLAGGFILDKIESTISNAFKLLSGATFFGAICCFGAFCFKSLYGFIPFFSVGELLVFATQAPVNYICLHCVKPSLRPLSMAMSTVSIHIFGDVPSSPLVGLLQDKIHNWRATALTLTSILFIAAIFWFIGIFVRSVDRFNEQSEHGLPAAERSNLRPLLDQNDEARASE